jgi:hypothetical protein
MSCERSNQISFTTGLLMVRFESSINIVAALGLALGAVFGLAGTFVVQPDIQALLCAIDGRAS